MNEFTDIDRHFARFIARFGGGEAMELAAARLSQSVRQGHICLRIAETLAESRAVGPPDAVTPLVLDGDRLYLRRYFNDETALAKALLARASGGTPVEGQEAAIERALASPLTILAGGPGTGKTATAAQILRRMEPLPRVALAAPTGKAAARLEAAFGGLRASTLHRLLGIRPDGGRPRYHAANPLALDMLVVDEVSMAPLPLLRMLFDALPPTARVLLLGDPDQLASVDPGSVLADVVDAASVPGSPLGGTLAVLRRNYRFDAGSPVARACEAIREGRSDALESKPLPKKLDEALREPVLEGYGPLGQERDPVKALEALERFRILCAVRQGPYGVEELNRRAAALLQREAGTPILITQNAPGLGLFNGDTGILLPDPSEPDGPLWAWFPGERRIAPAQLPPYEPAFAMTVHKSQGSEFDRVLLVLPEHDNPVLTRELLYTGLTRARRRADLWANPDVLETAVARRTERASGLRERLTSVF